MFGEEGYLAPRPRILRAKTVIITAVISIFLAFMSEQIAFNHLSWETLGMLLDRKFIQVHPYQQRLDTFWESFVVWLTVDSIFYFVVICGLLVIVDKLRRLWKSN